ncbi:MAG: hypothetical protein HFG28_10335 [Eubacterium sp.]|nr:hypothetical protein [Eubacterium sp.]
MNGKISKHECRPYREKILFSAQCGHPAIEAAILASCNQIDEELGNGTVIKKIQAKKDIISGKPVYRYHDTKFSLSKRQIIDLSNGVPKKNEGFCQYSAAWDSKHGVTLEDGKTAGLLSMVQEMHDGVN